MRRYEQLLEDYEDAYFALLMDQVAKQEGERLEQQNQELIEDPNFEVPETTDQKCLRTIERCFARQQRQTALRSVTHILHYAAIIIAVSILVFTTAFAISEDFRVATRNLLITVNERYTDFRMKIEDPSNNTSQASVSGQSSNGVGMLPTLTTSLWDGYRKGFSLSEMSITIGCSTKIAMVNGYKFFSQTIKLQSN